MALPGVVRPLHDSRRCNVAPNKVSTLRDHHMKLTKGVLILLPTLAIAACDRYRITFNERTVSEPPPLFTDFEVSDYGLRNCLAQTIGERGIRRAGELVRLVCSHAGISSLDGIEIFTELATLGLANNQLTTIEPLLRLGKLRSVSLTANPQLDCGQALMLEQATGAEIQLPEHCQSTPKP